MPILSHFSKLHFFQRLNIEHPPDSHIIMISSIDILQNMFPIAVSPRNYAPWNKRKKNKDGYPQKEVPSSYNRNYSVTYY